MGELQAQKTATSVHLKQLRGSAIQEDREGEDSMAFQPRHKCGLGINEVVEVVPGAVGSDGAPIGYTFTIEGKPAESVLRFQDGPYISATPPTSASSGDETSDVPGMTSTANGITPEASLAAIGDHLEALAAKTGDQGLSQAFDHVRQAIVRLNEYRQRDERPKPAEGVDATAAAISDGPASAEPQTSEPSSTGGLESGSRQQSSRLVESEAPPAIAEQRPANTRAAPISPDPALRQMRHLTRRGFATGAIAALTGAAGWGWLRSRAASDGIPWPLRRMLEWNQLVAQGYFRPTRLAPTFAITSARMPRVNGHVGLDGHFDPKSWSLHVNNTTGATPLRLSLADIKTLPRVNMTTELKCIEGWSDPVHWTGARLVDLAAKFGMANRTGLKLDLERVASDAFRYVMLSTPDNAYYVGLDVESAFHPQTLLCYEMNGMPLTLEHGAPLRLAIPVKYGIKNLKRIGTIHFTDERPADYWAERGYDWYAGH
jgi:DMSO/TMAO reductase YedYZ molybdopterin-dependent catalytic subunit